ncbi:MAG: hypothetical protein ACI9OI_002130 [Chitinophagales bacterium]|jgi:hypothetical protein
MLEFLNHIKTNRCGEIESRTVAPIRSLSGLSRRSFSIIKALVITASLLLTNVVAAVETSSKTSAASALVPVDAFNYVRAKTALQFDKYLARSGGKLNNFSHSRNVVGIDGQSSKRLNRDTLYSVAIVDISQGATLIMPEFGDRYISVQVVNQDGFTNKIYHDGGEHSLTMQEFDTPYVWILVRTLVFNSIAGDIEVANALQDQMRVDSASAKSYGHPDYDPVSFADTTALLLELGKAIKDNSGAAGTKEQVDPIKQLLLNAYGFGTLPQTESLLISVEPNLPSDKAYTLNVKDVPVDGFWSLAMYNKNGYFEENKYSAYGFSNLTALKNADGSITLHFGGDPDSVNYIPLTKGWNYVVRLYQPRAELLDGTWTFPEVQRISN